MDNIYQPLILSIYDKIKKLNIILSLAAFFDFDKFFVGMGKNTKNEVMDVNSKINENEYVYIKKIEFLTHYFY